jgi:hypothetical protein
MVKRLWRRFYNWVEYNVWTDCEHPSWYLREHPGLTDGRTVADIIWTCTACGAIAVHRNP